MSRCDSFITFGDLKVFCEKHNNHKVHWLYMATSNGLRVTMTWNDETGFESQTTKDRVEALLENGLK